VICPAIQDDQHPCTNGPDDYEQIEALAVPGAFKLTQGYVIAAGTVGGTPVTILNSGQQASGGFDINYEILADSTGEFLGNPPGPSQVVTNKPAAWTAATGGAWMSIQPDQSVATRGGKYLNTGTTYETRFVVTDPNHVSLDFTVAADDYVDVKLNGQTVYTHTSTNMTATPATFRLTSGVPAQAGIAPPISTGSQQNRLHRLEQQRRPHRTERGHRKHAVARWKTLLSRGQRPEWFRHPQYTHRILSAGCGGSASRPELRQCRWGLRRLLMPEHRRQVPMGWRHSLESHRRYSGRAGGYGNSDQAVDRRQSVLGPFDFW